MTLPRATLRRSPEDFLVDELPAYEPGGAGEHLFLHIRKRGLTTPDAAAALASAFACDARATGWAGMKDRHAVTTQWISLPFPLARELGEVRGEVAPGLEVLEVRRHGNKLKPGHLLGNRFTITLRDLPADAVDAVAQTLTAIGARGVPNAFGPQRFGRDGSNAERALAWLAGRAHGPRNPREQRLLFSSLQSHLFNAVLARREAEGTWDVPLLGDVVKKRDTGGLFVCEDETTDQARARAGEVAPTGPMFGAKMRSPSGRPHEIEQETLLSVAGAADAFDRHRNLGEGTRRSLLLEVDAMQVERLPSGTDVRVSFVLPKGGYATTVLGRAVELVDVAARPAAGARDESSDPANEPLDA